MGDIVPYAATSSALVAHRRLDPEVEAAEREKRIKGAEELEKKLQRIQEEVPTVVRWVSSSGAGAGSGDFHTYRKIRRAEQDRQKRIEVEAKQQERVDEFEAKRQQAQKELEEKTAKRRAKRQKKKKGKKKAAVGADGKPADGSSDDSDASGDEGPGVAALD